MIILDTHVLVWAIEDDPRLGKTSRGLIEQESETGRIIVPAISLWEIAMLVARGRLALGQDLHGWTNEVLGLQAIELGDLLPAISIDAVTLPGTFRADPADRMIVATARFHRAALLTADAQILDYAASGHLIAQDAQA